MMDDVVLLSRIQFALTIMFHYLFPPLTIGLSLIMVVIEGMYLKTGKIIYEQMAKFWTRIFAVNFALGVASGIVMEFQFGTNWAAYSRFVGDVFGSALAAEGIFAFFLESGFLALLVFGWNRISPKMHFFSTVMVSLGSIFSAVWIVVANSWQQTPVGHHVVMHEGMLRAEVTDFWALVFNPSSMPRLTHVLLAAFHLGAFFVLSITAYYILRGRFMDFAKKSFVIALFVGLASAIALPIVGHHKAKIVAQYQPAKLAAFEGHFHTGEGGSPLYLWGWPDEKTKTVKGGVAIPGLLSWLVYGDAQKPVSGLDQFSAEDWAPVALSFVSYHLMIVIGIFSLLLLVLATWLWVKNKLFQQRWLLKTFIFSVWASYTANMAGWTATEVGRQPWVVYGLMRTKDGVSAAISSQHVLFSIILFGMIYMLLFVVWIYVLNHKIQHGPDLSYEEKPKPTGALLSTAGFWVNPTGASFTEAKSEKDEDTHGS